jgi:hypothetical protein
MYNGPMGIFEDYDDDILDSEPTLEDYAFIEGYDAYLNDAPNPYSEYPHLSRAWQRGLENRRQQEQDALDFLNAYLPAIAL